RGLVFPSRRTRVLALLVAALQMAVLFHLGMLAGRAGLLAAPFDKLAHLGYFGCLAGLFWIGSGGSPWRSALVALAMVALFGAADETVQAYTPGRDASALDWLADMVGALLAVTTLSLLRARFVTGAGRPIATSAVR
ncbi:MAG: VanZ family protein, partial [Burkholderiaceae bacterium]